MEVVTNLTVGNYGATKSLIAEVIAGGEAPLKMFWARIITTTQLVTCPTEHAIRIEPSALYCRYIPTIKVKS